MPFQAKSYSCGPNGNVRLLTNLNHGNWVNIPVPQAIGVSAELYDIATDPNNGDNVFTVGDGYPPTFTPTFYGVAVSNNAGTTWNIPGGDYQTANVNNANAGITYKWNKVVVIDSLVSYIIGDADEFHRYGNIAKSTDGGLTYNIIPWQNTCPGAIPLLTNVNFTSVYFSTPLIGVVGLAELPLVGSFIIKTTDGGANWSILNGGGPITTALLPNAPGTLLPIGDITGISMRANQEHIVAVGLDFVISTIPVPSGSPTAGVAVDSWRNNILTINGPPNTPPVYGGFRNNIFPYTPLLHIGVHIGTLAGNDSRIWVSGDDSLGVTSSDNGDINWITSPGYGWDPFNTGFSRRASHFYREYPPSTSWLEGFYNKDQAVWWNFKGFDTPDVILSDTPPGLTYIPNALWTWYLELPSCFTLTDCADGSVIFTNTDLSVFIGMTITISEYPGHCYVVTEDCTGGSIPEVVTPIDSFTNCSECAPPVPGPCECPSGTILTTLPNGTRVCRTDTIALAEGPNPSRGCDMIAAVIGSDPIFPQNVTYNQFGASIYQDIASRPWPVTPYVDPSCTIANFFFRDNSTALVSVTNNPINTLWGDGSSITSGRHNNAAVWNHFWDPTICAGNPAVGFYGFTSCLTVTTTTTYFFATSGRTFQLKINGSVAVENTSGTIFGTNTLHVFPITLPAGTYILEMNGAEVGTGICNTVPVNTTGFIWEIYSGPGLTPTTLSAMTTPGQLLAVTVYSTLNESGITFDQGSDPYNHRCPQVGQALDNCFANPLNPNNNPNIYVCHSYVDIPVKGCCYVLTDCSDPNITYITSTDLSIYAYQNKVITVAEYVGCFTVSLAPDCGPISQPPVTVLQAYIDCITCLPKCYQLVSCEPDAVQIITNTDLSLLLGMVVKIEGSDTCYTVVPAGGCVGSIAVVITASFLDCAACAPVCYQLVNCRDNTQSLITSTDLSLYVGQFIHIDGTDICWEVIVANTCVGSIPVILVETFVDCETCNPTPPPPPIPPLRPRSVKPGYTTPGCDPAYTENVYCGFAKAVYDQMLITRYGITMCCNDPIEKWLVKKQLLDLRAIYDPELCKNLFDKCCPPCAITATLNVYYPVIPSCPAPTNMIAILEVPPTQCPAPTGVQVSIVMNPTMQCVCYLITSLNPPTICDFNYTDCLGINSVVSVSGPTYICSITMPTTLCQPNEYSIQAILVNCSNGECHS